MTTLRSTEASRTTWFGSIRIHVLILLLVICLLFVLLITHYQVALLAAASADRIKSDSQLSIDDDHSQLMVGHEMPPMILRRLHSRLDELNRIRLSVGAELRDIEARRHQLISEVSSLQAQAEQLKIGYEHAKRQETKLKESLERTRIKKSEEAAKRMPVLQIPYQIFPNAGPVQSNFVNPPNKHAQSCTMHNCWDFSRCSITSNMPVYVYPVSYSDVSYISSVLSRNGHLTQDPATACLYLVILQPPFPQNVTTYFQSLPFWSGVGRNHVVLLSSSVAKIPNYVNFGEAIVVSSSFYSFQPDFDVVIPPLLPKKQHPWQGLPYIAPAHRQFLLTFHATPDERSGNKEQILHVVQTLKKIALAQKMSLELSCPSAIYGEHGEWSSCQSEKKFLRNTTFALILSCSHASTYLIQHRLYSALQNGAIPVVVGPVRLPLQEILEWHRAAVILPMARLPELEIFLLTLEDSHILEMRRFGRSIWQTVLSSGESVMLSVLAVLRRRLDMPAPPLPSHPSHSIFPPNVTLLTEEVVDAVAVDLDDTLGPVEPAVASPSYRGNFSYLFDPFGLPGLDPFHSFPSHPFSNPMPADAKFKGSSYGFRPIGQGNGSDGREFVKALGGNYPREQFTVVMLTYEREAVLINALVRLKGLPYLNKVIVVWNSFHSPSSDIKWPEIGVPIKIVKTEKNSLNNRFLPYSAIETDAILSVDDDALLRHDEIVFGFRVWRESRDRIVGFPGRYHTRAGAGDSWFYNSNHSCELSMVLTGAAFFHRCYAYLYTHTMPRAIRDKVDEYMNCEDIAFNFLVSHVTRKPPIKVTSRWTFRCPGCPKALSADDEHFQERHKCINFFVQVYGYMPLLHTQFRVDSILFKTKIPHDKQKCFKYI